jgi:hypothetical protein
MKKPSSSSPDRLRDESQSGAFRDNHAKTARFLRLQTVATEQVVVEAASKPEREVTCRQSDDNP